MNLDLSFYRGKKILVTGHTGFKGTWLSRILINAGAIVTGYSLNPPTNPNLFDRSGLKERLINILGDVRDFDHMKQVFEEYQPEIVFHLAAQSLVRDSYKEPRNTYETNVMGTVNIMECVRRYSCVKSVLNVTTDKVYQNNEWFWGYREDEPLNGFDPYSNSKSCSELVTHSYNNSFFSDGRVAVSTARAGNVIGGGDFANNRIIPDCIRAVITGKSICVRNPHSIRPYQHVLEPLAVYLIIASKQYENRIFAGYYNVGPDDCDCITTGELVNIFCKYWGEDATWRNCVDENAPHEASYLKLDCSKIKTIFDWKPHWHIDQCIKMICQFNKIWLDNGDIPMEMDKEIQEFFCV